MENTDIVTVGIGSVASVLFQLFKGHGWNPWLLRILALGSGFGAGYGLDGTAGGVHTSTAALATYAVAFQGTKLGDAFSQGWGPKLMVAASKWLSDSAKALAGENGKPPTPPA